MVTDPQDAKDATLAALAAWAAHTRAELVAAAWHAGNRDITELARVARRQRQAIYQDLRSQGIDPPTDRKEPPVMTTPKSAATIVPVPGWRHPNLTSVAVEPCFGGDRYSYTIQAFTGTEPKPEIPEEWMSRRADDGPDAVEARWRELGWVRQDWAQARYELLFKALYKPSHDDGATILQAFMKEEGHRRRHNTLYYHHPVGYTGTAADVWRTYAAARDNLAAAYEAMKTQPDNMWRAGLGKILDATRPAETAADNWDYVGRHFVAITDWYHNYVPANDRPGTQQQITQTGKKLGLDVTDWTVACSESDYDRGTDASTAQGELAGIIERGAAWIKNVSRLASNR